MNRIIYIFISTFIISCQVKEENHIEYDQKLLGKYVIDHSGGDITLELNRNGTFKYKNQFWACTGGGKVYKRTGTFEIDSNRLKMNPKTIINLKYNELDFRPFRKDSLDYYLSDSTRIRTEYHFIHWEKIIFLLSEEHYNQWNYPIDENDFILFANDYNAGRKMEDNPSFFMKKTKDFIPSKKLDSSSFPKKYQHLLLKKAINTEIIDIKKEVNKKNNKLTSIYKINKGSKDNISNFMLFYGKEKCCKIKIFDVHESSSLGKRVWCHDDETVCKKGEIISTIP